RSTNPISAAVYGECRTPGTGCYAIEGAGRDGTFASFLTGGRGNYLEADDSNWPAIDAHAYGAGGYGLSVTGEVYRGVVAARNNTGNWGLFVDKMSGETTNDNVLDAAASVRIEGNLTVLGSKGGYVVDAMQNVDGAALE